MKNKLEYFFLGAALVLLVAAAGGNLYYGSFQDDGSGRTSLPYASLVKSNSFGVLGNMFPATVFYNPTNVYLSSGTCSTSGQFTLTSANGAFGGTNMINTAQLSGLGYQIQIPTNGTTINGFTVNNANNPAFGAATYQAWIWEIVNSNKVFYRPGASIIPLTTVSFFIYPASIVFRDTTPAANGGPNVQSDVQSDGTYETYCGTKTANATGGGIFFNDFAYSTRLTMHAAGGIWGECFSLLSTTNNEGPTFNISPLAPNYCWGILPSGLNVFEVGITNDSGQLLIANPTLSGTIQAGATNSGPANTLTPARWLGIAIGGTNYRVQLYQ